MAELIKLISLDNPRNVEELKLTAEELDSDTGRSVYVKIYCGTETISDLAQSLGISVQLASYHVEKLLMAGLIRERGDGNWFSQKGKRVAHYVPSNAALLIVPSAEIMKKAGKERVRSSMGSVLKKIFYSSALGASVIFILNRAAVSLQSSTTHIEAFSSISQATPQLYTVFIPVTAGITVAIILFMFFYMKKQITARESAG
jgi:DNA-binding transcriptional ArsR family regulator